MSSQVLLRNWASHHSKARTGTGVHVCIVEVCLQTHSISWGPGPKTSRSHQTHKDYVLTGIQQVVCNSWVAYLELCVARLNGETNKPIGMQDLKRESQSMEAALPSTSPNACTLKCCMNLKIFASGYSLLGSSVSLPQCKNL